MLNCLHQAGVGITLAVLEPEHRFFVHNIAHHGPAEATKLVTFHRSHGNLKILSCLFFRSRSGMS